MTHIILLSSGDYSDYSVRSVCVPIKEFTFAQALEEFKAQWKPDPDITWRDSPDSEEFINWLFSEGYVTETDNVEIHCGSYSNLELSEESKNYKAQP